MYTPESKVKHFLDSLAYFLLLGRTDGIETSYRRVMHAKREIPLSSCTSDIDNLLYASNVLTDNAREDEVAQFREMVSRLDENASLYEAPKVSKPKIKSRFSKKLKKGISGGKWYRVDTEGKFWVGNNQYRVEDNEVQYQPVKTEYGDYYAMDKILYANGKFYDMNYDDVKVRAVGGIIPYDNMFWAEN